MMLEEKGNMRVVLLTVWYLSDQSMVLEQYVLRQVWKHYNISFILSSEEIWGNE